MLGFLCGNSHLAYSICFIDPSRTDPNATPLAGPPQFSPAPLSAACPFVNGSIINGICVIQGNIEVSDPVTIVEDVFIVGNFSSSPNTTITINYPKVINITGCATLDGTLVYNISSQNVSSVNVLYYTCHNGQFSTVHVVGSDNCTTYTGTPQYDAGKLSLAFTFAQAEGCNQVQNNTLAIALGVSLGTVGLVAIVIGLLVAFNPKVRAKFRPFSKRNANDTLMK